VNETVVINNKLREMSFFAMVKTIDESIQQDVKQIDEKTD
jgi:FAD synthase